MSELPTLPEMEAAEKLTKRFLEEIGEHVDTCQVFVTRKRDDGKDGTSHFDEGIGNWFARFGHVKVWVIRQEDPRNAADFWDEDDE